MQMALWRIKRIDSETGTNPSAPLAQRITVQDKDTGAEEVFTMTGDAVSDFSPELVLAQLCVRGYDPNDMGSCT